MGSEFAIETRGLTKYYGANRGVEGLDFQIQRGEFFGFLGPNGAGKTTTIRLLLNLIKPNSGIARILGMDTVNNSLEVRRHCGVVISDPAFFQHLTGRKHLSLVESFHENEHSRGNELADRLQLDLDRPIRTYSRGTKQKLAIIQSLAHNPDVLIMDEPTMGLDPLVQQEFYRILLEEQKKGKTVFLSSHILSDVERVCDRVGIIRDGQLAAILDIEDLHRRRIRRMEVTLTRDAKAEEFEWSDAQVIQIDGPYVVLKVSGNISEIIRSLGNLPLVDVVFPEASLEDTFTEFYTGREESQ
jgi:ABC-2 type transport system ATP-binding protein